MNEDGSWADCDAASVAESAAEPVVGSPAGSIGPSSSAVASVVGSVADSAISRTDPKVGAQRASSGSEGAWLQ
eukprot:11158585-Lingulodinium_polyedra.AAC.1